MADITLRQKSPSLISTDPFNSASASGPANPAFLSFEEMDDNFIHLQNSKENQLGVPAVSGYLLSSDVNGNRSWVEPLVSGTVNGSFLIWNTSTKKWTEETSIIYDATDDDFKWGAGNTVIGGLSTGWGVGNNASGSNSTVWGSQNTVNNSNGTAWGIQNTASGLYNTVWGRNNTINGNTVTGWGSGNTISDDYSTVWGRGNSIVGKYATAWGRDNSIVGTSVPNSGDYATIWGSGNTTNGDFSTVWGVNINNEGVYTTVIGFSPDSQGVITKDRAFILYSPDGGVGFGDVNPDDDTFSIQLGRVEKITVNQTNPVSINLTTDDYMVSVNTSSDAQTVALLSNPTTGRTFYIVDESGNANTNNITVNGNGQNINGSSTYVINTDYGFVKVVYNGTQYLVIGKD